MEAIEAETKLLDECDVVVPVNQIAPYLNYVNSVGEKYDFAVKSFGHAGDGNLHIYACSNDLDEETFKNKWKNLCKTFIEKLLSWEDKFQENTESDLEKWNSYMNLQEM